MKKTALLLVITMLISVFSGFGAVFAEEATVVKGPATTPFAVSATEATELTATTFTASNIYIADSANPWYNKQSFATLEAGATYQKFVAYDLDVEKAGAYNVTAYIGTTAKKAGVRILRPGKVTPSPDGNFATCGDVVLAEGSVKTTATTTGFVANDLGVIYLEEGINRIALSNIAESATAFYYQKMVLTPSEETAPTVVSVRDAKELKNSDGSNESIISSIAAQISPYISFGSGDYHVYDVTIPSDGIYSFTTFGSYGNKYTLTDITDEANPVTLINGALVPANGASTIASPYEVAQIDLKAGTYTWKFEALQSGHYSYFTLRKITDSLGTNIQYAQSGKTVKIPFSAYTSFSHTANLDFSTSGLEEGGEAWREYKIYAEKAGDYSFVLNYATPNEETGIIIDVNGETVLGDLIPATGQWGNYTDITMGNISLAAGENVIKLTPEGTFNMPSFSLVPEGITTVMAETATNIETDGLTTINYDGGKTVKLANGNKLEIPVTVEKAANYDISIFATVSMGSRKVTLSKDTQAVTSEIAGEEHGEYSNIALGTLYLEEGENTVTVQLDEGFYMYVNNISLTESLNTEIPSEEPTEEPSEEPTEEPSEEPVPPAVDIETAQKGPQEGAFYVEAEGETKLSPLYYTSANMYINPDAPWYTLEGRTYASLEAYPSVHHMISYDLYVKEAGSYRVKADISAPSQNSLLQLMRPGKNDTATGDDLTYGDVIISKTALIKTANSSTRAINDLGVIWLDKGVNRLTFANSRQAAKAFYFFGATIEKVDEAPEIVVSVRDYVEGINASDSANEPIYSNIAGMPNITPYISFGAGDYMTYDVTIPSDGIYSFTVYGAYAQKYTLTDITDAENPVVLADAVLVNGNGTGNTASPYEVALVNLTAGKHTLKLSASQSNHFTYFTLKKVSDVLEEKQIFLPAGASITVPYASFTANSITAGLDFGYGGWREYTIVAETAGDYEFVLSYGATGESGMIVALDGEDVLGDVLPATGGWGVYTDVNLGTLSLKKGANVIKLSPEGTFNMPNFKLNRVCAAEVKASDASNIETDALSTLKYGDGTVVALSAGQKLDIAITAPKAGFYAIGANASAIFGENIVSCTAGDKVNSQKAVSGTAHGSYSYLNLGTVYLAEGENNVTLTLAEGREIYFNTIYIDEISASFAEADGTITAKAKLSGAFAGEEKMIAVAVYEIAGTTKKLKAVNMELKTITVGDAIEISVDAEKASDKTYEAKLFILDENLKGLSFEE